MNRLPKETNVKYSWSEDPFYTITRPLVRDREEILGKKHERVVFVVRNPLYPEETNALLRDGFSISSPVIIKSLSRRLLNRRTAYIISYFEQIPHNLNMYGGRWDNPESLSPSQKRFLDEFMTRSQANLKFTKDPAISFPKEDISEDPHPEKIKGNYHSTPLNVPVPEKP